MSKPITELGNQRLKQRIYQALKKDGPSPTQSFSITSLRRSKHTTSITRLQSYRQPSLSNHKTYQRKQQSEPNQLRIRKSHSFREPIKKLLVNNNEVADFKVQPSRCSKKCSGMIYAFAGNTSTGPIKNYNQDRVSMIINFNKLEKSPSFFGVYDGHGGCTCSQFLKDNLHLLFSKQPNLLADPVSALISALHKAQTLFLKYAQQNMDISGSCCLVAINIDNKLIVANIGDSRAVYSKGLGSKICALSKDHKPNCKQQLSRIKKSGGGVLQSMTKSGQYLYRVVPGQLSVSRTIGDIQCKNQQMGGISGVIISKPDIQVIDIKDDSDFLILGSKLLNRAMVYLIKIWQTALQNRMPDVHTLVGLCAQNLISYAVSKKARDNLSVIILAFENFGRYFYKSTQINRNVVKVLQKTKTY